MCGVHAKVSDEDRISHHLQCNVNRGGVGNVMFALSWFITWYSHVLDNLDIILRLYDLFIVSHFLMPIYVAAEVDISLSLSLSLSQRFVYSIRLLIFTPLKSCRPIVICRPCIST